MAFSLFCAWQRIAPARPSSRRLPVVIEALEGRVLASTSAPVLFTSDFESGSLSGWTQDIKGNGSITIVNAPGSPVRAGQRAAKFVLNAGNQRSELYKQSDPRGSERWFGFSVFLPKDWAADPYPTIVAQWHEVPDFKLGETWRVPPLYLAAVNDQWLISSRWDKRPVSNNSWSPKPPNGGRKDYHPGALQKGVWTDWVFHVKWSYKSDGILQVWQNGKKVIDQKGPDTYNDQTAPYFKMGVYQPDYKLNAHPVTPQKVAYLDEMREGGANAKYADVAPPGPH